MRLLSLGIFGSTPISFFVAFNWRTLDVFLPPLHELILGNGEITLLRDGTGLVMGLFSLDSHAC